MNCQPSEEQKQILTEFDNYNIIVDAVPGSGKTTQIQFVAEKYKDLSILVITYSRRLMEDTKARLEDFANAQVYTFHKLAGEIFGEICMTDAQLDNCMDFCGNPQYPEYDMIILDEVQDMKWLYHKFAINFIQPTTMVMILGDAKQNIYSGFDSDVDYLINANHHFGKSQRPFRKMTLSVSYRLTKPICDFLNNCFCEIAIKPNPAKCCKHTWPKPELRNINLKFWGRNPNCEIFDEICQIIEKCKSQFGYKNDDIFILAPSIKGDISRNQASPLVQFANYISSKKDYIFVPDYDSENCSDRVMKNKIVFCTFHKAKGLERKLVIVFGFDESYTAYYNKGGDASQLPNALYVALTRAKERLILLKNSTTANLACFSAIREYFDEIGKEGKIYACNPSTKVKILNPSSMFDYMDSRTEKALLSSLEQIAICPISYEIAISNEQFQFPEHYECTANITGTYFGALHQYLHTGSSPIFGDLAGDIYDKAVISKMLRAATNYCSEMSGYKFKKFQIKKYNWVKPAQVRQVVERLTVIPYNSGIKYEEPMVLNIANSREIVGRTDILDEGTAEIWELKFAKMLTSAHKFQLAMYSLKYPGYTCKLLNLRTGECLAISPKSEFSHIWLNWELSR
jgi:hypothetical protein